VVQQVGPGAPLVQQVMFSMITPIIQLVKGLFVALWSNHLPDLRIGLKPALS
jgi:hypothetical protein